LAILAILLTPHVQPRRDSNWMPVFEKVQLISARKIMSTILAVMFD